MWIFCTIPFLLQAIAIGIDEGYFHFRRGLPKWERIGHPLDTFSLLVCFCAAYALPFDGFNLKIYMGLAVISCIMVTKDEFVHKEHCPAAENWLHALLFILHPITLIVLGLMWPVIHGQAIPEWLSFWLDDVYAIDLFLKLQITAIVAFMSYQVIYWNFIWKIKSSVKM